MTKNENIEKIKEILNKAINSIWLPIFIGIIIFFKAILFYNNTINIDDKLELETIIGTMSFSIVLVCFLCVLPNRGRVISAICIDIFFSILLFSDNVYYIYSNSVLSVAQITNLQYGEEIMSTLPMVIQAKQILYFVDIIIFMLLIIFKIFKIYKKEKNTRKQLILKYIVGIIGVIMFCVVSVQYIQKGKEKSYNKDLQIREATIFGYHIFDIKNVLNIKNQTKYKNYKDMFYDYENLKKQYETEYSNTEDNLKGILQDKNVIILQLESIQEFVINKEINGKQITPNLNKFLSENIKFTNMHMQSYSTTADSEHSTITSLYPMENGMSFSKYYTNTYDDLFKIFKNSNYYTSYMHGNYPYFWNRGNVYGRLKLDDLSLKEQFSDLSENIHTPYTLEGLQDRSKITIDVGKYKDTYFGDYLEAVNYADYAFGVFIDELKKEGLYDDTAILVFGDHNGINMYNEEMIDFLNYIDKDLTDVDLKLNYTRVACGMKIPGIKNIKIDKPVNKLDIKPTLAYLCNVQDGISLGTNMFGRKDFVSLNNERIIANDYYYDEEWYNRKTGEQINMETINQNTKQMLNKYYENMKTELDISNSISINNLLK